MQNTPIGRADDLKVIPAGVLLTSEKLQPKVATFQADRLSAAGPFGLQSRGAPSAATLVAAPAVDAVAQATRGAAIAAVAQDLADNGVLTAKGEITASTRAELEFSFRTTLPTPGVVIDAGWPDGGGAFHTLAVGVRGYACGLLGRRFKYGASPPVHSGAFWPRSGRAGGSAMRRSMVWVAGIVWVLAGCGDKSSKTSEGIQQLAQEPGSEAPSTPAPASPSAPAEDEAVGPEDNPCAKPAPQTLKLNAGEIMETPWGLEITYAIDEDRNGAPSYIFLLHHKGRRWETSRSARNWNERMTWRGFCWRGGERPERKASTVQIEMAPVCKDGKLVELGGCGDTLK